MINGIFVGNTPWISLLVAWGQSVKNQAFILDTGFTGDLQVTRKISQELSLKETGVERVGIADGSEVLMPSALAIASMEGAANHVNVLISKGSPLAGIGLLSKFGYKAIVDCKHRTVSLEKVR
jgi:predicted aspartyl protease